MRSRFATIPRSWMVVCVSKQFGQRHPCQFKADDHLQHDHLQLENTFGHPEACGGRRGGTRLQRNRKSASSACLCLLGSSYHLVRTEKEKRQTTAVNQVEPLWLALASLSRQTRDLVRDFQMYHTTTHIHMRCNRNGKVQQHPRRGQAAAILRTLPVLASPVVRFRCYSPPPPRHAFSTNRVRWGHRGPPQISNLGCGGRSGAAH